RHAVAHRLAILPRHRLGRDEQLITAIRALDRLVRVGRLTGGQAHGAEGGVEKTELGVSLLHFADRGDETASARIPRRRHYWRGVVGKQFQLSSQTGYVDRLRHLNRTPGDSLP